MKINAIITGATGMVGEGVLHECLLSADVESVLVVGRKSCGIVHPKLKEFLTPDLAQLSSFDKELSGYSACFFCMGVSSVGMNAAIYQKLTYDLTLSFAKHVSALNPGMTFCYVSGAGTDSTEKGRSAWARVKGKTENDLQKLPFKKAFMFRPGYIHPTPGLKNTLKMYRLVAPLYPIWKLLFPKYVCTLRNVGLAMIGCATIGFEKVILDCPDINRLAEVK